MRAPPQRLICSHGEGWEVARHLPPPPLAAYVAGCTGYREQTAAAMLRRETPVPRVVMIIHLGPPLLVAGVRRPLGFAAGVSDSYTLVEHGGEMAGIQIDFTLAGAFRFFAMPMRELAGQVLGLCDLLGDAEAARLVERLAEARDWAGRFAILDEVLLARLAGGPALTPWVAWAWSQIQSSGGQIPIGPRARCWCRRGARRSRAVSPPNGPLRARSG